MAKTVVGLFDTYNEAQIVVQELLEHGVANGDISMVANNSSGELTQYASTGEESAAAEGAGAGAVGGTVVGGVLGLLVGLGALAIPGIGPVLAVGPLAAAIGSGAAAAGTAALGAGIGAATGGLLGGLVGAGVPEEDANYYSEGVKRGGTLITVQASDEMADSVHDIMQSHGAVDIDERGAQWREGGFSRFDDTATGDAGDTYQDSSKAGTAGGTVAGAATGAAIGAAGGPVGAVIGGVAGAVTGAGAGAAGDVAGKKAENESHDPTRADMGTTGSMAGTTGRRTPGTRRIYDTPSTTGISTGGTGTTSTGMGDAAAAGDAYADSSKAGTAGGALAGAATGAAIGAVGGPVGAVIGGVAGAVTGGGVGAAGDAAGEAAEQSGAFDDNYYRNDYDTNYASSGGSYDDYQPAYRYGYDLAADPMYSGKHWNDIEGDVRSGWDVDRYGPWERAKDAVRRSWERTTGGMR